MNLFLTNFLPLAVEAILVLGVLVILLHFAYTQLNSVIYIKYGCTLLGLGVLISGWQLANLTWLAQDSWLQLEPIAVIGQLILCLAASILLYVSPVTALTTELRKNITAEYVVIILLALGALIFLLKAQNFLLLYLAIELQSLAFYILVGLLKQSKSSIAVSLQYYLLGSLASGIMLYGISLIYGFSGTIDFVLLHKQLSTAHYWSPIGLSAGLVLFLIGLFFKLSLVPFHLWTVDLYAKAATLSVSWIAIFPKFASVLVLYKLTHIVFMPLSYIWQPILLFMGLLTMVVGALGGCRQTMLKKILAYSTIKHLGIITILLSLLLEQSFWYVFCYLCVYLSGSLGLFIFLLTVQAQRRELVTLEHLSGLATNQPALTLLIVILLLSLLGFPPTSGFIVKFIVFKALIASQMWSATAIMLISNVIAAYYYLQMLRSCFIQKAVIYKTSSNVLYGLTIIHLLFPLMLIWY